jgi:hypothetical protein
LQSIIARALENDKYVLVSSLDLSSAFDLVNVNLLLKGLRTVDISEYVIEINSVQLRHRFYFLSVDTKISFLTEILLGAVQGSIWGPVLYAIYVSPIFYLEFLPAFTDDNYILRFRDNLLSLTREMEESLEKISKWLKLQAFASIMKTLRYACSINIK